MATSDSFIRRCEEWLCDGYSIDTRFIATQSSKDLRLFDAAILMNPLPHVVDNSLTISAPPLSAGQEQVASVTKDQLMTAIRRAVAGTITVNGVELRLPKEHEYRFQPTFVDQNTWFQPLSLQVFGSAGDTLLERHVVDSALRAGTPPFDGAEDLRAWLGLRLPDSTSLSSLALFINPPVDLILDRSSLSDGKLRLVLHAHPGANKSLVRIAVREAPGDRLSARTQVADKIAWGEPSEGRVEAIAEIALPSASGALVMLLVGGETVRRHWFIDSSKAPNLRHTAVNQFDPDLRMIRRGLLEDSDSKRFETAIGTLLFLLGFSAAVQLESDSPDLIVLTPLGRLVIVECTTRVADVSAKLGKLVDRREALQRRLRAGNAGAEVSAALVCRAPRDQIAAHSDNLKAQRIVLVAGEEIADGLARAWATNNPDDILDQALRTLLS